MNQPKTMNLSRATALLHQLRQKLRTTALLRQKLPEDAARLTALYV